MIKLVNVYKYFNKGKKSEVRVMSQTRQKNIRKSYF